MRKKWYPAVLLLLLAGAALRGAPVEVVAANRPVGGIVVPEATGDTATDNYYRSLAELLQRYVERATRAKLPIYAENAVPAELPAVAIGPTRRAVSAGVGTSDLKWDAARLRTVGRTVFLVGRDTPAIGPEARERGARGTARAVVRFLEKYLGYRSFVPTPQGERLARTDALVVPETLDETVTPAFAYAFPLLYGRDTAAAYQSPFRYAIRIYTVGGHIWPVFVPAARYFDRHPEYFIMRDGKRVRTEQGHLCTSNPEVRDILIREIRKKFDAGYEWVSLSQSDGWEPCRCPACEALDDYQGAFSIDERQQEFFRNHPCERIHLLHKAVIDACKKSHPDRMLQLLSYHPTVWPSKKFDFYGDNVIVECTHLPALPYWRGKTAGLCTYVYCFNSWEAPGVGPKNTPRNVAEQLRSQYRQGVIGIYFCGLGDNWGLEGPSYYVLNRLLMEPELDYEPLVTEYCGFVYGPAGGTMERFFNLLHRRVEGFLPLMSQETYNRIEPIVTLLYPPAVLRELGGMLAQAEREAAGDARATGFLKVTKLYFEALKLQSELFHLNRAFEINRTAANLDAVERAVNAWKAYKNSLFELEKDQQFMTDYFPGWDGFFGARNYYLYRGHCHSRNCGSRFEHLPPMNYDFAKLRAELGR